MKLIFQLYLKHIWQTIKNPLKYFGIWLATGTWLPWLMWTGMFRDDRKDGGLVFLVGMILFLTSIISVAITYGCFYGTIGLYESIRDYFKSLREKVQQEIRVKTLNDRAGCMFDPENCPHGDGPHVPVVRNPLLPTPRPTRIVRKRKVSKKETETPVVIEQPTEEPKSANRLDSVQ